MTASRLIGWVVIPTLALEFPVAGMLTNGTIGALVGSAGSLLALTLYVTHV